MNLLQSKESVNKEKINPLTFYIIPRYNDKILTEADKRCRYMIDNNLKYYKLRNHDYAYLQHMFNTPVIINGQNKRPDKQAVVMNNINKEFSRMLNDCNMVSKELITRNVKCSKKTVDKQWGYLIKKNRLLSRRPTIKEKEEYNLNTNLYIATR